MLLDLEVSNVSSFVSQKGRRGLQEGPRDELVGRCALEGPPRGRDPSRPLGGVGGVGGVGGGGGYVV